MKLFCAIFIFCLFHIQTKGDLADEVQDLVDELRSTVDAAITVAVDAINNGIDGLITKEQNYYAQMVADIEEEFLAVWLRVLKIKELAIGYDISVCLQWREDIILHMPQRCRNDTDACLLPWGEVLESTRVDSVNEVKLFSGNVDTLDEQVATCNGNLDCLSALITTIELDQVNIPQNINLRVQKVNDDIADVDVEIKACTDAGLSYMAVNGNMATDAILDCAENIIG